MGGLAEERVREAVRAPERSRAATVSTRVLAGDEPINDLHIEVDDRCFKLLALHQPMAADLRVIVAAVKINTDLERVGDLAVNIAEAGKRYLQHAPVKPLIDIPRMGDLAQRMLRDALDAFVRRDIAMAEARAGRGRRPRRAQDADLPRAADLHAAGPGDDRAGPGPHPHLAPPRAHRRPRHQRGRGRHLHPVRPGRPPPGPRGTQARTTGTEAVSGIVSIAFRHPKSAFGTCIGMGCVGYNCADRAGHLGAAYRRPGILGTLGFVLWRTR